MTKSLSPYIQSSSLSHLKKHWADEIDAFHQFDIDVHVIGNLTGSLHLLLQDDINLIPMKWNQFKPAPEFSHSVSWPFLGQAIPSISEYSESRIVPDGPPWWIHDGMHTDQAGRSYGCTESAINLLSFFHPYRGEGSNHTWVDTSEWSTIACRWDMSMRSLASCHLSCRARW